MQTVRTMGNFYLPIMKDAGDIFSRVQKVLGRDDLDYWDVHELIAEEWAAFYDEPEKYAGSVVVDMVNQFLDEYRSTEDTSKYNAQSVMLDDLN